MRSFSDISKMLTESKEICDSMLRGWELPQRLKKNEQKFKENYFSEVDEFLHHPSNNFKNALPILILIEKNKDTFLGGLLIKQVAFPLLCMSYPKYKSPYMFIRAINNFRPIPRETIPLHEEKENEEKYHQEFTNGVNTKLSTAITTVANNIRLPEGINSILHHYSFFPSTLNNLIIEYDAEDIVARRDIWLRSIEIDFKNSELTLMSALNVLGNISDEDRQKARANETPILTRKQINDSIKIDVFFMYGNSDRDGAWRETLICCSPCDEATLLNKLPFDEKVLKGDDIRFTDHLMEILKNGHFFTIDYTSPSLRR